MIITQSQLAKHYLNRYHIEYLSCELSKQIISSLSRVYTYSLPPWLYDIHPIRKLKGFTQVKAI
jgi:hypothetical protein